MKQTMMGNEIHQLMKNIQESLQGQGIGPIKLDDRESMYTGFTDTPNHKIEKYVIGIKELTDNPEETYPMDEALAPIVTIFHETCGHGGQLELEFGKETALSKVLALNYYAGQCSKTYYEDNYWDHPHEIAAQYAGIKNTYQYLSVAWGEQEANEALCAYQQYRFEVGYSYLKERKSYTEVSEILDDLNTQFQQSVWEHRMFDCDRVKQIRSPYQYFARNDQTSYSDHISSCRNGLKQDLMMAAVFLHVEDRDHQLQDSSPVLKSLQVPLSRAAQYFTKPIQPKPKPQDLDLKNLESRVKQWQEKSVPPNLILTENDLKELKDDNILKL